MNSSLQFIVNASRAVLLGLIDVGMYYRICSAWTEPIGFDDFGGHRRKC